MPLEAIACCERSRLFADPAPMIMVIRGSGWRGTFQDRSTSGDVGRIFSPRARRHGLDGRVAEGGRRLTEGIAVEIIVVMNTWRCIDDTYDSGQRQ